MRSRRWFRSILPAVCMAWLATTAASRPTLAGGLGWVSGSLSAGSTHVAGGPPQSHTSAPTGGEVVVQQAEPPSASREHPFRFENLTTADGLSSTVVQSILQDRQGYMWFGTEFGLNKYDGYGFTIYHEVPGDPASLVGTDVEVLYEDRQGTLWIATADALNSFDRKTGAFTEKQLGYLVAPPSAVYEDSRGEFWVGAYGLRRYDNSNDESATLYFHRDTDPSSLSHDRVTEVYEDRDGVLWIGTVDGLNRFDRATESFTRYHTAASGAPFYEYIAAIAEDQTGDLWIGTANWGLHRLDRSTEEFTSFRHDPDDPSSLSHDRVTSVLEDRAGRLWIGTLDGLNVFNRARNSFARYGHDPDDPKSLSADAVLSLYEDRAGVLWVGTIGGLSKVSQWENRFPLYQKDPGSPGGLSDGVVTAVLEDSHGALWVGTFNGGLNRIDRLSGQVTVFQHDPGDAASLAQNEVRAIYEDEEGTLWIGTGDGLDQFDPQTQKFFHMPSLNGKFTTMVWDTSSNNLLLGAASGLYRYSPSTGYIVPPKLVDGYISGIYQDQAGAFWVGTYGDGVAIVERDEVTHYVHDPEDPQSLSNDLVGPVFVDQMGVAWIGTWRGLNRFDRDTQTFYGYTEQDGLSGDSVRCILADPDGMLWISTSRGLSRFDPRSTTFQNFDARDGVQGGEFLSCSQSSRGEMFFGGIQGMNAFYPDQIESNPHVPPVVITAFVIRNQTVRTDLPPNEHIELPYDENFIAFEFAALDYVKPQKNQYAYMLEGLDQDWVAARERRYADYPDLRPGNYIFRVKGSNNDGVWNEEGVALYVTITPPFWQTVWFISLLSALLIGSVYVGYRLRVRSIETRSHELEKEVEERTTEVSRANVLLTQEIGERKLAEEALAEERAEAAVVAERQRFARDLHDSVSQSMYGVTLQADAAERQLSSGHVDKATGHLRKLRDTVKEATRDMRLLVFELRPPIVREDGLAAALEARLEAVEGHAGLKTYLEVVGTGRLPPDIEEGLYRIALEALTNAMKYAQAHSLSISLRLGQQLAVLEIADDGVGFDPSIAGERGGMGLPGMVERAEQMGGQLIVESEPGAGTRVRVQVEVGQ